jgi:tRNA(fMet)-specific endonuclease VapC
MPARFMLDTNIISDMVRNPKGHAARRARRVQDQLCTSIVVAAELRYGCARKGSPTLLRRIEDVLDEIEVLPLDVPADADYGTIRSELEAAGRPIGANDLFIAAHAISRELTLVTANVREFSRIGGLKIENWIGR